MAWPQTGATLYHAQLGLPDKSMLNFAQKRLISVKMMWVGGTSTPAGSSTSAGPYPNPALYSVQ